VNGKKIDKTSIRITNAIKLLERFLKKVNSSVRYIGPRAFLLAKNGFLKSNKTNKEIRNVKILPDLLFKDKAE